MIEAASEVSPISGAKAVSTKPGDGFDVGEFLRLCKGDPTSTAGLEYLERFPEAKRRYDARASGSPVGTSPTDQAWGRLQAIDRIGVLKDRFREGEWRAIVARNPDKVLGFISAMEKEGWHDRFGKEIKNRIGYLARPTQEESW